MVDLEGSNFLLDPANVRRNDTSAASINEWTGERLNRGENITDDIKPDTISPLGNYAVQILWQDGFNQASVVLDNNNNDVDDDVKINSNIKTIYHHQHHHHHVNRPLSLFSWPTQRLNDFH